MSALFGVEQEYGLAVAGDGFADQRRNEAAAATIVERLAAEVSLPAAEKTGRYLPNGSLVYPDRHRLELAGPETLDPLDTVRYIDAGHRLLERTIAVCYPDPAARPRLWVAATDPVSGNSCGSHLNYLYRADGPNPRTEAFLAHQVGQIVFTGSGGLEFSPGIRFVTSPRALTLELSRSVTTGRRRGILDLVEDGIRSREYRRCHLISPDPLLGQVGNYLKVGTNAVVLALVADGEPLDTIALADAVTALHALTRDPSCRVEMLLSRGGSSTALDIEFWLLEAAEARLSEPWMPAFAADVCRVWRQVLEALEAEPPTSPASRIATRLDWAIRYRVFERVLVRHGFDWATCARWSSAMEALAASMETQWPGFPDPVVLLDPAWHQAARSAGAERLFETQGLAWAVDDLRRFVACRHAVCEADIRFGELSSDRGIFRTLDRAGVLNHRMDGITDADIERAMDEPPPGRASVRGAAVRQLSQVDRLRFMADWDRITDRSGAYLDLTDPLEPDGRWRARCGRLIGDDWKAVEESEGRAPRRRRWSRRKAPTTPPLDFSPKQDVDTGTRTPGGATT
jgi:hypothetical protein